MSSSSTLEVATLFFISELIGGVALLLEEKALLCEEAEHYYAGNNCGIIFMSVMAKGGHAFFAAYHSLLPQFVHFVYRILYASVHFCLIRP